MTCSVERPIDVIDRTMKTLSTLVLLLLAAPFTGHEALLRLAKAQQALLEAGGNLARVHGSLLDVQREMAIGDECPPDEPTGQLERIAG